VQCRLRSAGRVLTYAAFRSPAAEPLAGSRPSAASKCRDFSQRSCGPRPPSASVSASANSAFSLRVFVDGGGCLCESRLDEASLTLCAPQKPSERSYPAPCRSSSKACARPCIRVVLLPKFRPAWVAHALRHRPAEPFGEHLLLFEIMFGAVSTGTGVNITPNAATRSLRLSAAAVDRAGGGIVVRPNPACGRMSSAMPGSAALSGFQAHTRISRAPRAGAPARFDDRPCVVYDIVARPGCCAP